MSHKDNHGAGGASIKQLDDGKRGAGCNVAVETAMLDASRGTLGPLVRIVGDDASGQRSLVDQLLSEREGCGPWLRILQNGAAAAISDGDENIAPGLLTGDGLLRSEIGQ